MTASNPSGGPRRRRSDTPFARSGALMRRYPVTATVTGLTAAVGAAQLHRPDLLGVLQRDPAQLHAGEWWRLVTPLLVQSDGVGQYAYNLAGSALVGVAVESRHGHARWLGYYLASGLAGQLVAYHTQPHTTGAGSSEAVAGLIGALAVSMLSDRELTAWPARGLSPSRPSPARSRLSGCTGHRSRLEQRATSRPACQPRARPRPQAEDALSIVRRRRSASAHGV